jgi:hypothetical protein
MSYGLRTRLLLILRLKEVLTSRPRNTGRHIQQSHQLRNPIHHSVRSLQPQSHGMSQKKHCLSRGTATQPNRPFQPSLNDDESARLAQEAEGRKRSLSVQPEYTSRAKSNSKRSQWSLWRNANAPNLQIATCGNARTFCATCLPRLPVPERGPARQGVVCISRE